MPQQPMQPASAPEQPVTALAQTPPEAADAAPPEAAAAAPPPATLSDIFAALQRAPGTDHGEEAPP
jgi:hypothetical protein